MDWFVFALLAALLLASSRNLVRYGLRDHGDSSAFAVLNNVFAALVLIPLLLLEPVELPAKATTWILFFLAMVFYALGDWTAVNALKQVEASIHMVLNKIKVVWVLIGGWMLYQEAITFGKMFGIICLLIGSVVILWQGKKLHFPKGIIFTFLSTFTLAAAFLSDKTIVNHYSLALYGIATYVFPSLFILLPMKDKLTRLKKELKLQKHIVILSGALFGLYFICQLYAFKTGEVSRVTPVMESNIMLSVLISILFLKERDNLLSKLIGSIIVFTSILAIKFL